MDEHWEKLQAALLTPSAYSPTPTQVETHETHISQVFLVRDFAYKLKKPIGTSFLDYRTLSQRLDMCAKEVELNRRFAGDLYIGVVPIVETPLGYRVEGDGEPIEYAVKMHRFPAGALMAERLRRGELTEAEVERFANRLSDFYRDAEQASPSAIYGTLGSIAAFAHANFDALLPGADQDVLAALRTLEAWTFDFLQQHTDAFEGRRAAGQIRACHGDLHLENIVYWRGEFVPFDGIEFNEALRWNDTLCDFAFPFMDFAARGHWDLAYVFINQMLERGGEYRDVSLLKWYAVYRALVRAMVLGLRLGQSDLTPAERLSIQADQRAHIELARTIALPSKRPKLWITHGVSGSGKSHGSKRFIGAERMIRLRSDIERKRVSPGAATLSASDRNRGSRYSEGTRQGVYDHLYRQATALLDAGESVLVDATFLLQAERERFHQLAAQRDVAFGILHFEATVEVLQRRLLQRASEGVDPSEADCDVMESQLHSLEPLTVAERELRVSF